MKKEKMKFSSRVTVSMLICLLAVINLKAQTLADTIRNEIIAINDRYDSAFYLTFDVNIQYGTYMTDVSSVSTADTMHTEYEMKGTYTFHGNKALYRLGDIEYMQNETYTIGVYNNTQMMLVGKIQPGTPAGKFVPTRALVDSMSVQLEQDYTFYYSWHPVDSSRIITCVALDTAAVYQQIVITYDPETHYLSNIKYDMKDYEEDPTISVGQPFRRVLMFFRFSRYRAEQAGPEVFNEDKYLFFAGPEDIRPSNAYTGYAIYKSF